MLLFLIKRDEKCHLWYSCCLGNYILFTRYSGNSGQHEKLKTNYFVHSGLQTNLTIFFFLVMIFFFASWGHFEIPDSFKCCHMYELCIKYSEKIKNHVQMFWTFCTRFTHVAVSETNDSERLLAGLVFLTKFDCNISDILWGLEIATALNRAEQMRACICREHDRPSKWCLWQATGSPFLRFFKWQIKLERKVSFCCTGIRCKVWWCRHDRSYHVKSLCCRCKLPR